MKKELRSIAVQTRKTLESISREILIEAEPSLAGLCGYASLMLSSALEKKGYHAQIIQGRGHWFVECQGFLMDITASQFGQPSVVVKDYKLAQDAITRRKVKQFWWEPQGIDSVEKNAYLKEYNKRLNGILERRAKDIKDKRLTSLTKANQIRKERLMGK